MAFRFVHTADVHLDSPLRSLALRGGELAGLIGNATRRAFTAIVDLCLEERVDALLLAGDLYDGDQTSMKTARFLAEQIRRLDAANVKVFIIRGNHDALSRITQELTFPPSVTLFTGRADVISVEAEGGLPIAVHGLSFSQPAAIDSLLPRYRPPVAGAVNIGLMHTSLDGSLGHDPYAPCKLSDLQNTGFGYWALGHIHKRTVYPGRCTIVMPGMPQGRDINESGAKSVSLVTIADDRSVHVEERRTSIAQFERVSVDLTAAETWRDAVLTVGQSLAHAKSAVPSEHLIARVTVFGATPVAWRLRRDFELMRTEAVDRADSLGNCWVEGLEVACQSPASVAVTGTVMPADPLDELRRLIDSDVVRSEAYQSEVREIADELRNQLPKECRRFIGNDEAAFDTLIRDIIGAGVEDVLARLQSRDTAEDA